MAYATRSAGHPGALGLTLAVNAGAVLALILYNPDFITKGPTVLPTTSYPIDEPPPVDPPPADPQPDVKRQPAERTTIIATTGESTWTFDPQPPPPPPDTGTRVEPPPPPPPPAIIRTAAKIDMRPGTLQPPYPPAMQRQEKEGVAVVRVQVGPDGRPTDIVLVRADDPDFFSATRSWGLRNWRFKPATEDGRAVSGWVSLTVKFTLD